MFNELDEKVIETQDQLNEIMRRFSNFGDLDEKFQESTKNLDASITTLSRSGAQFIEMSEALKHAVKNMDEISKVLIASEPSKILSRLDKIETNLNNQLKVTQEFGDRIGEITTKCKVDINDNGLILNEIKSESNESNEKISSQINQILDGIKEVKATKPKVNITLALVIVSILLGGMNLWKILF